MGKENVVQNLPRSCVSSMPFNGFEFQPPTHRRKMHTPDTILQSMNLADHEL